MASRYIYVVQLPTGAFMGRTGTVHDITEAEAFSKSIDAAIAAVARYGEQYTTATIQRMEA